MNQKSFVKRLLAVALGIIMVTSIMPIQAFAISHDTYDISYRTQSKDNPAQIRYGLTDSSAGSFSIDDDIENIEFRLSLNNGWYLEKWDTWFKGGEDKEWAIDPKYDERNPVVGSVTFYNAQNGQLTNNVFIIVQNLCVLYGDFRIDAIVRPILTVNAGDGIRYQISTNNPLTTNLSSNQVAVVYENDATVTYSVDNKYVVTDVSANYGTTYSDNGAKVTVNSIKKPATVTISTKLKQQNVIFNANGGEGTMSAQVFEHSVAQTLNENNFTKTGYTFAGWNTKADGTGTAYTDKQSVNFTPVNDGESITLYAQWTACTNHQWENGECTECGTVCSHSGGTATCIAQAVCTTCSLPYGEFAGHDWGNWISNNDGTHTRTCTNDANHTETNDCSGGTATCTEKAECSVCTTEYGDILLHTYGTEWKSDGTNHWHECSCGAKADEAAHSGGTATCTEKAVCSDCGQPYDDMLGHDWGDWISNNDGTHTRTCKNNASHTETNDCSGGTATCTEKAECSVCTTEYGNILPHTYGTEWKSDGTNHWHECSCGAKADEAAHSGGTATCTDKAVCSVCSVAYGELAAHTYEKGKCTVCKGTDPNCVPETSNPQTGDNSNVALRMALLFISGGATIMLTVVDRKRKSAASK